MPLRYLSFIASLIFPCFAYAGPWGEGGGRTLAGQIGAMTFLMLQAVCFLLFLNKSQFFLDKKKSYPKSVVKALVMLIFFVSILVQYSLASWLTLSLASGIAIATFGPLLIAFVLLLFTSRARTSIRTLIKSGFGLLIVNALLTVSLWIAVGLTHYDLPYFFQGIYHELNRWVADQSKLLVILTTPFHSDKRMVVWWTLVNVVISIMFFWLVVRRPTMSKDPLYSKKNLDW